MNGKLQGISSGQRDELYRLLEDLMQLMTALGAAAEKGDAAAVRKIQADIEGYRKKVEAIRRTGTAGTA